MKSNDLLDAIGEVSDEYIADAENVEKRRMPRWARWSCAAAACLVAVAGIGVLRCSTTSIRLRDRNSQSVYRTV